MKTGMQKKTEQKYLNVFSQIFHAVRMNPKVNLNHICASNNVAHNLPTIMRRVGILEKTSNGIYWKDVPPNLKQVERVCEYRSEVLQKGKVINNQVDLFTSIKNEKTTEPIKRKRKPVISQENVQKDIVLTNNNSFELKLFGLSIIKIAR